MFVGRKSELNRLEEFYAADRSNIIVLYGRKGIGKTTLVDRFLQGKAAVKYSAAQATDSLQQSLILRSFGASEGEELFDVFKNALRKAAKDENSSEKRVLVIDEFQNMASGGAMISELIIGLFTAVSRGEMSNIMIVLVSSSVNWVENMMVGNLGASARLISGYLKLSELEFRDIVGMYRNLDIEECITLKGVLGGIPGYLRYWKDGVTAKENITRLFLSERALLAGEAELVLKSELRELSTYNYILTLMAAGKNKLNELFEATGFSRAKISVYIKNLIEMDVVEKIFSYDETGHENLQKGLYRIKDSFVAFYYAFIFPNKSMIDRGEGEKVYNEYILPRLGEFLRPYYADVCREFLKLMSEHGRLKGKYSEFREWHGKKGTIDVVAGDGEGKQLVASCTYRQGEVDKSYFDELCELSEMAGIKPSEIFVFAKDGFTTEFKSFAETEKGRVNLVALSDL